MPCKLDHNQPDSLPEFLCRICHPELTPTPEQRARAIAAERAANEQRYTAERNARQLRYAERDLAALEQRQLVPDSVPDKIRIGLRQKVERLKLAA